MSPFDRRLLAALEPGLAIEPQPYERLAETLGVDQSVVLDRLDGLRDEGTISRFGVVVRHHELGYRANAMVVWDVPDGRAEAAGRILADLPFVTLCYRRPRRPPRWIYNLFCMIHGRDRAEVERQAANAGAQAGLGDCASDLLFSGRRFKQRGARYGASTPGAAA